MQRRAAISVVTFTCRIKCWLFSPRHQNRPNEIKRGLRNSDLSDLKLVVKILDTVWKILHIEILQKMYQARIVDLDNVKHPLKRNVS